MGNHWKNIPLFVSFFLAMLFLSSLSLSQNDIYVYPNNLTVYYPEYAEIRINIANASNLYGFQFDIIYNDTVLGFNKINKGDFLNQGNPGNTYCNPPNITRDRISLYACTRLVGGEVSGGGTLAVINMTMLRNNVTSPVRPDNVKLSDSFSMPLSFNVVNGTVIGLVCSEGQAVSCGPQNETGVCQFGLRTCSNGTLGICAGSVMPTDEVCDSLDNDCDGETDEIDCGGGGDPGGGDPGGGPGGGTGGCLNGQTRNCYEDGICQPAVETCNNSIWGECVGSRDPTPEVCNGIDDNCNGLIDDNDACCRTGETRECGPINAVGACMKGQSVCTNGVWGDCTGAVNPSAEVCDGIDNDCDGEVDDSCTGNVCSEGEITDGECICGEVVTAFGFCCSGIHYENGCPGYGIYLIVAGLVAIITLFVLTSLRKLKILKF